MLPYDENEDDFLENFSSRDRDELIDIFGSEDTAHAIAEFLGDNWHPNEGGFEASQIFDMIYEIDNFSMWEDDDGVIHYEFDYWWESEDGSYSGVGHVSS